MVIFFLYNLHIFVIFLNNLNSFVGYNMVVLAYMVLASDTSNTRVIQKIMGTSILFRNANCMVTKLGK